MRTKNIVMILSLALTAGLCQTAAPSQAATPKLSAKKLTMKVGKTATLKVKKTSKKAKWSIASGKKNIRLTAKKKTSVRVKAVKAGKAKISCKIGKKKLFCKVTVYGPIPPCVVSTQSPIVTASAAPTQQPTHSPAVTASATVAPTSTPTQTPIVTPNYEIKTINTPGPVADYDCLQVEPAGYKSYFNGEDVIIGAPWCKEIKFFGTDIWRNEIEQIIISDSNKVPKEALGQFDLSEKQNGSVMAWYTDKDNDGKYEMTIGQNGGVVANVNSSYLFSSIKNEEENEPFLVGIENLDTSHVESMRAMFYFSKDGTKEFDLGDQFDTSNVKDISNMFIEMGEGTLKKIRLGANFDVSKVEKQSGAFEYAGKPYELYCYVKDDATRQWFIEHAEDMCWYIGFYTSWDYKPGYNDYIVNEQSMGLAGMPIRTHEPTDNRIMAEPAKYTELPSKDENGYPISYVTDAKRYYFCGTEIKRDDIEELTIETSCKVPEKALGQFDLSEKQNGSVMAWYTDKDKDGLYEMTIGQEGGVVANPNCCYLFCDLSQINGMGNLYTSGVTDMSYMFLDYGANGKNNALDLEDNFDTSNVKRMDGMFAHLGARSEYYSLRLGKAFTFKGLEKVPLLIYYNTPMDLRGTVYVSSDEVRDYITKTIEGQSLVMYYEVVQEVRMF